MIKIELVVVKRNFIIHLLEESGVIQDFGSEIVSATFYNLENSGYDWGM